MNVFVQAGTKKNSFGEETDHLIQNLSLEQRRVHIGSTKAPGTHKQPTCLPLLQSCEDI